MTKFFGHIPQENQSKLNDLALFVLRAGFGLAMMFSHGVPKLMKLFGDDPIKFADPIGIGETTSFYLTVFAEFLCALLVAIGLKTRLATIPLIITMLVALFIVHGADPFNVKEMAALYFLAFFALLFTGPGKYSLDSMMNR